MQLRKNSDYSDFLLEEDSLDKVGQEMHHLMEELYPICRSITGNGVRETHEIIRKYIKLETHEVSSGTQVFDWTIPDEWNIKDAYVIDPHGNKIIDFKKSNLHILNYSIPINKKMTLDELTPHLFTIPDQPDMIPYRTSYYNQNWGFCLSQRQLLQLEDGEYHVVIDSTLKPGSLTYGEYYLKGKKEEEIVISCYTCHPSLCNDNLSGVVLTTFLAKYLEQFSLEYSYRFLFVPETIGAITWLSVNENNLSKIKCGLVVTCVGDSGNLTYKKSRQDNSEIDRFAINVLKHSCSQFKIIDFFPPGSDERQYCSLAFNLPFGSLMRSVYDTFPEYHTSYDNLQFVKAKFLADTFAKYLRIIYEIENNKKYLNLYPKCEPQLGRRGLYRSTGAQKKGYEFEYSIISLLSMADGKNSLLEISERTGIDFLLLKMAADELVKSGVLKEVSTN